MRITRKISLLLIMLCASRAQGNAQQQVQDSLASIYVSVQQAHNRLIVDQGMYKALFDRSGKPVTGFVYRSLTPGFNGWFVADNSQGTRLIDADGNVQALFRAKLHHTNIALHQYVAQLSYEKQSFVYDSLGRELFHYAFRDDDSSGLFTYDAGYQPMLMDTAGRVLLPGKYRYFLPGTHLIIASTDDSSYIFNRRLQLRFAVKAEEIKIVARYFIGIRNEGTWQIRDSNGRAISDKRFYMVEESHIPGYFLANRQVFDVTGKLLNDENYNFISPQPGGWYTLDIEGQLNDEIRDEKLQLVLKADEDQRFEFTGDRFILVQKGYNGLTQQVYDRRTRSFCNWPVQSHIAGDAYILKADNGFKKILRGNSVLDAPVFKSISRAAGGPFYYVSDYAEPEESSSRGRRLSIRTQVVAATNVRMGLLDSNMNTILPMRYTNIHVLSSELISAADSNGRKVYVFDRSGKLRYTLDAGTTLDRKYALIYVLQPGSTMLLDTTGRIVYKGKTAPSLLYAAPAEDLGSSSLPDLLVYDDSTGYSGVYNRSLHQLLPHRYYQVDRKVQGLFSFKKDDSVYFSNSQGRLLFGGRGFSGRRYYLLPGYVALLQDGTRHWGAIDAAGNTVLPFIYDTAGYHQELGYFVGSSGQYALLRNTGTLAYPLQSWFPQSISPYDIIAAPGGRYYKAIGGALVNPDATLSDVAWQQVHPFNWCEMTAVYPDNGTGLAPGIYNKFRRRIAGWMPQFNYECYRDRMMIADSGDRISVIDSSGRQLIPFIEHPDVLMLYDSAIITMYKGAGDQLYRLEQGSYKQYNIAVDAKFKDKYIAEYRRRMSWGAFLSFKSGDVAYGMISRSGAVLLDAAVSGVTPQNNYYIVRRNGKYGLMDDQLRYLQQPDADAIKAGTDIFYIARGDKKGVYMTGSRTLIDPVYDQVYHPETLSSGYVMVRLNGKLSLLNRQQQQLIPFVDSIDKKIAGVNHTLVYLNGVEAALSVDSLGKVHIDTGAAAKPLRAGTSGYAARIVIIERNGKYGLYSNDSFRYILPITYDVIEQAGNEKQYVAWLYKPDKIKGIDSTILVSDEGRSVLRRKGFFALYPLRDCGLILLNRDQRTPAINKQGKTVIPEGYSIAPIEEHSSWVQLSKDGLKGIADCDGNIVLPVKYSGLDNFRFENGYFTAAAYTGKDRELQLALVSPQGKLITGLDYDDIEENEANGTCTTPFYIVEKKELQGLINNAGKLLLSPRYDEIKAVYKDRYVVASIKEKWGILDLRTGKQLLPFKYEEYDETLEEKRRELVATEE